MLWANSQIYKHRHAVNGKWVYVLDDDDWLTDTCFIEQLKEIDSSNDVSIIICKGYIGNRLYPSEGFWKKKPLRGTIGSPNFIIRQDLFLDYAKKWCKDKAGDFFFINTAYQYGKTYWWDKKVFTAPIGNGLSE